MKPGPIEDEINSQISASLSPLPGLIFVTDQKQKQKNLVGQ
jgi:hypothetical protein